MSLAAVLLLFTVAALAVALLPVHARTGVAAIAGATAVAGLIGLAVRFPEVRDGGVSVTRIAWVPSIGLELMLRLDGLTWMFGVLVVGIGALVVLYARYYLSPSDPVRRFYAFLLAFIAAMLGTVFSGNLLQLAFFWELTSLVSFLLIGYWTQRRDAQRGARMALTVTGVGGLCLLAGVIVLGQIAGSYDVDRVLASAGQIKAHALYPLALCLILLGAFTKSAQVPFHFWLPNAMAAPTPVSAYLHSATMVKLGVFLLARLWPALSGTPLWFWLVGSAGLVTLLFAAWVALFRNDLKSAARVLHRLAPRPHRAAARAQQPARRGGGGVPRHEPRDVQGVAVHGRRHHRPRDRHARSAAAVRAVSPDAVHQHAGAGRDGGDGRRAAAQRLPVEGDVLRRGRLHRRRAGDQVGAAGRRDAGGDGQRRVFAALRAWGRSSDRRRRATRRASPRSRRGGCACRSTCWCSRAWWSASRRAGDGAAARRRRPAGRRWSAAGVQPQALARLHRRRC